MELAIKNIILYDEHGNVSGFAEFKIRGHATNIKVRYNDGGGAALQFSIVANGEAAKTFRMTGVQSLFEMRGRIDAELEIFVSVSRCENGEMKTLASGVINENRINAEEHLSGTAAEVHPEVPAVNHEALEELDEAIRKICVIDENGKGQCETCPYREHFFGASSAEDGDDVVV